MPSAAIQRESNGQLVSFVFVRCENPQTQQRVIEPLDRPNVSGHAFRELGEKGKPWRAIAFRDFPNTTSARRAAQLLRDELVGELVTLWADDGIGYGRMMLLDVRERFVRPAATIVGGLGNTGGGGLLVMDGGPGAAAVAEFEFLLVHASAPTA